MINLLLKKFSIFLLMLLSGFQSLNAQVCNLKVNSSVNVFGDSILMFRHQNNLYTIGSLIERTIRVKFFIDTSRCVCFGLEVKSLGDSTESYTLKEFFIDTNSVKIETMEVKIRLTSDIHLDILDNELMIYSPKPGNPITYNLTDPKEYCRIRKFFDEHSE